MTENKKATKIDRGKEKLRKTGSFLWRWLYLIIFLASAAYAGWIWNQYIFHAEWSEEKKQSYIKEQSVFTFDSKGYQQAMDLVNSRKERLSSDYKFSGKDIFFPEGF